VNVPRGLLKAGRKVQFTVRTIRCEWTAPCTSPLPNGHQRQKDEATRSRFVLMLNYFVSISCIQSGHECRWFPRRACITCATSCIIDVAVAVSTNLSLKVRVQYALDAPSSSCVAQRFLLPALMSAKDQFPRVLFWSYLEGIDTVEDAISRIVDELR